ncbi:hypothetical protein HU200_003421 [Digitaria exilis]|uniref:rRNA N-glycosylase n=1 Tax=Digitaria exilis TaxID=1010633 RepID=A0A835KTB0_9POAL|nr:hypothetical protein HU200_003421 [Digitaria exilis]
MVGSGSLHSDGAYLDLLGDSVHICKIGFQSLLHAFRILASYAEGTEKHKEAIAVILVMFFEAPRLQELYDMSLRLLEDKLDEQVGVTNKNLINRWSNMCRDFYWENGCVKRDVKLAENTGPATQKVAKSVRILCRSPLDNWFEENNVPAMKEGESSGSQ